MSYNDVEAGGGSSSGRKRGQQPSPTTQQQQLPKEMRDANQRIQTSLVKLQANLKEL